MAVLVICPQQRQSQSHAPAPSLCEVEGESAWQSHVTDPKTPKQERRRATQTTPMRCMYDFITGESTATHSFVNQPGVLFKNIRDAVQHRHPSAGRPEAVLPGRLARSRGELLSLAVMLARSQCV